MRYGMKQIRSLIVKHYTARWIDLNKYLFSFLGANSADKIGVTELNEILLNSITKICSKQASKQAYVQGFDCEYIKEKLLTCLRAWKLQNLFTKV